MAFAMQPQQVLSTQPSRLQFVAGRSVVPARGRQTLRVHAAASTTATPVSTTGKASLQGTSRKQNEDRLVLETLSAASAGDPMVYAAVYDGHGGYATSWWLQQNLLNLVKENWNASRPEAAITDAFLKADSKLLAPQGGFLGLGERGVGGSKCGASAAVAVIYTDTTGASQLLTANVGDSRVLLVRDGQVLQLTEDHVPDNEEERNRIEATNPNPKMPLVRYIGRTWRVGGLLALSRAFGDAYMKSDLQFEGLSTDEGFSDGYNSGFGVIAEPYTQITTLTSKDSWLIVCSDGLFANEERGGGSGLENEELAGMLAKVGPNANLDEAAFRLAEAAVERGSTDDVTVTLLRLSVAGGDT